MSSSAPNNWLAAARVYGDRRVLSLLFLGFSSGLPFGVLADPLSAWLFEAGVSKTAIGLFALVSIPYSLKFLWAPLMDRLSLPPLTTWLGRRRGWAMASQLLLAAAVLAMGFSRPDIDPWWTALLAVVVAFASASQDIVVDAYRIDILDERRFAAGSATAVFGWRVGYTGGTAAALIAADILPWSLVFGGLAAAMLVGILAILLNPEPPAPDGDDSAFQGQVDQALAARAHLPHAVAATLAWLVVAVIGPLRDFIRRPGWLAIIGFILLYKYGDAVLGVMKTPFFLDLGFSKTEIAEVAKVFGVFAIIAGGFLGGWALATLGLMRGLLICGVLMALSNLVFVVQALVGPELWMLTITIATENVTTGMGTTAFVAYLSSLCDRAYSATQYALLTSFMAISRTVLSSGSGWLADSLGWSGFFVATTLAAIPGLALLLWMMRRYPAKS